MMASILLRVGDIPVKTSAHKDVFEKHVDQVLEAMQRGLWCGVIGRGGFWWIIPIEYRLQNNIN